MALDFGNKVENSGADSSGKISAVEWNQMIAQINKNESDVTSLDGKAVKKVALNGKELSPSNGVLTVNSQSSYTYQPWKDIPRYGISSVDWTTGTVTLSEDSTIAVGDYISFCSDEIANGFYSFYTNTWPFVKGNFNLGGFINYKVTAVTDAKTIISTEMINTSATLSDFRTIKLMLITSVNYVDTFIELPDNLKNTPFKIELNTVKHCLPEDVHPEFDSCTLLYNEKKQCINKLYTIDWISGLINICKITVFNKEAFNLVESWQGDTSQKCCISYFNDGYSLADAYYLCLPSRIIDFNSTITISKI